MTEPIETPADSPADGRADTPEGKDTGEQPKGNREARYRVERNEAREALAAAEARIAHLHRAEVERLAAGSLSHPEDLFSLSGNALSDYLDDDGMVDPVKVAADVSEILRERPGLKRLARPVDTSQGHGGGKPPVPTGPTSFIGLLG